MKKKLIVLTALLVLSSVVLGTAYGTLQSSMNQVEVEYATWMGDPAAAEGLELKLNSSMENRLFWETTLDWGNEPETEFSYFREGQIRRDDDYGLNIWSDLYGASYGENLLREWETNDFSTYEEWEFNLFLDVSSRTEPGTKRTEVVDLRDYTEVIPIGLGLQWEGLAGPHINLVTDEYAAFDVPELQAWGEFVQELKRAFQMPILQRIWVSASVEKDKDGEVVMTELRPASGQTEAVVEGPTEGNDSASVSCQEDLTQISVANAVGQQYDYFVIETKTGVLDYSHTRAAMGSTGCRSI